MDDTVTRTDLLLLGGCLAAFYLCGLAEAYLERARRRAAHVRFPPADEPAPVHRPRPWAGRWRLIRNEECGCTAWVSPSGRVAANMPCRQCREWVLAHAVCLASQDDPERN